MRLSIKSVGSENLEGNVFRKLGKKADDFESYSHQHAERIAAIADELARHFNLATKDRQSLRAAALLHDLGEATMNRDYLRRAGLLTSDERLDLARHPLIGEQEAAKVGADRATQLIVRWHHEWWNGTGYPDVLRHEQIPLAARIIRVADSYAALTDARPYRPALTQEEARNSLSVWAGIEFDPRVVATFLTLNNLESLRSFATQTPETESDFRPAPDAPSDWSRLTGI